MNMYAMLIIHGVACGFFISCHCVESSKGPGRPAGGSTGLPICSGGHRDGARVWPRQWAVEPLSLDLQPAVFFVSAHAILLRCFGSYSLTPGARAHAHTSRGHFVEWLLGRPDVAPVWDRFIHHPFVMAMGNGSLPLASFKGYLVQDYLYLVCIRP